jgi:hypothetical protein
MRCYILKYTDTNLFYGKGDVMTDRKKAVKFATKEQAQQTAKASKLGTTIIWKEVKKTTMT